VVVWSWWWCRVVGGGGGGVVVAVKSTCSAWLSIYVV